MTSGIKKPTGFPRRAFQFPDLFFESGDCVAGLGLNVLHHLPDAAGADARAEPAADALGLIHDVLEGLVRELLSRDRAVVARLLAHAAVAAGAARHAAVRFLLGRELDVA